MKISTRREAAEAGLKRFYTGKPCKFGHDAERFTTTGGCVKCNAERSKLFATNTAKAVNARAQGLFTYPCHPDDAAALLAYAQGLDLARGRVPHVPEKPQAVEAITPERIREMRAQALGKVVDLVGTQDRPRVDSAEAWLRDVPGLRS